MRKISAYPGPKINNDKGYVLLWTVIISMVLVIAVAAVLSMSFSHNLRSTNNNSERQAYFTARSVVNALAYEIQGPQPTADGENILNILYDSNGYCTINDFQFEGTDAFMGNCTASLKKEQIGNKDTILITATAKVGNRSKSVSARLVFVDGGEQASFATFNISSARGFIYGLQTGVGTNLYLESAEGNVKFDTKSQNQQNLLLRGDLYVGTPLWLQASHYPAPHAHGNIISSKNIYIFDTFTVGPYAGCCERANTATQIHTPGTVSIEDSASVYSTITAQTVNASASCRIYNDISGDVVNISGNAVISGNITANTIYLSGNAQITGDVTAGSLNMDGSAKISGQVNAYNLSIKSRAIIEGDVIAKSVTASGVINNPLIMGTLTVEAAIGPNVTASVYQLGIPYTGSLTPVAAIVSKLPVLPEEPDLPLQPADAETFNNAEAILGYTDGRDSYYVADRRLNVGTLKTQGSGNIYLYVPSGSRLTLHQMQTLNMTNPNLYIIVENGGTLLFANESKDFYGYIYGKYRSSVDLGDRTHIYGGVRAEDVVFGLDNHIEFPANTSDPQGGNGSSGQWILSGYENP